MEDINLLKMTLEREKNEIDLKTISKSDMTDKIWDGLSTSQRFDLKFRWRDESTIDMDKVLKTKITISGKDYYLMESKLELLEKLNSNSNFIELVVVSRSYDSGPVPDSWMPNQYCYVNRKTLNINKKLIEEFTDEFSKPLLKKS